MNLISHRLVKAPILQPRVLIYLGALHLRLYPPDSLIAKQLHFAGYHVYCSICSMQR